LTAPDFRGSVALVTGAAGFVGAHLVRGLIGRGARVVGLVRSSTDLWRLEEVKSAIELCRVDLLDFVAVEQAIAALSPNFVFHTATIRDETAWEATLATNAAALLNLARVAVGPHLRHFVHLGSSLEYGAVAAPFAERAAVAPTSFFGATKAAGTLLLQQFARSRDLPLTILRLFHVYGPMEPRQRLIPTAIRALENGTPLRLTAKGFVHDPVFVDDVVEACLKAAGRVGESAAILNIASGAPVSNEEIVTLLSRLIGRNPILEAEAFPARSWDRSDWFAEIVSAREALNWSPQTPLALGLEKTIAWQRRHEQ
jgi:nucleoside-diphosphate-sugar epimerase